MSKEDGEDTLNIPSDQERFDAENASLREVIRELIPIAEGHLATVSEWRLIKKEERGFWTRKVNEYRAIIEKAKILTK